MKIPLYSFFAYCVLMLSILSFSNNSVYANKVKTETATETAKTSIDTENNSIALLAPKIAEAGTVIQLEWKVEQAFDGLLTLKYTDDAVVYREIPIYVHKGASYALRLPAKAGTVQVSLYQAQQPVAQKNITLKQSPITLNADQQVIAGNKLTVEWQAPKNLDAFINIQAAKDTANYYAQPHINVSNKKEAIMQTPTQEGDYVLRWYNRQDRHILAELPLKLIDSKIVIIAPDRAMSGTKLPLSWQAAAGLEAFINIQASNEVADYKATPYVYINDDYTADLQLPSEAGNYVLRWYDRNSHEVLAQKPITLTGSSISIQAPEEAPIGAEIEIKWRSPKNLDAFINLQLAEEKADYNATPYIYTQKKQQGKMQMPQQAGEYILRWYNRTDHKMLTEKKITLVNKVIEK